MEYTNISYTNIKDEWQQLEDCYNEQIKANSIKYLPKTSGMERDKKYGELRYQAYKRRANYFNHIKETVNNSKNAIQRKPVIIENLPDNMEYLLESFNSDNESLEAVLDDIYTEQLKVGRVGYLVDIIEETNIFETVQYKATSILDWSFERRKGIKKVVFILLSESIEEIDSSGITKIVIKKRILGLDNNDRYYTILLEEEESNYIGLFKKSSTEMIAHFGERVIYPMYVGKILNFIPFQVANSDNLKFDIQQAPLLNQSNLSIGVYNADANHQHLVYMQAASLLFFSGLSDEDKTKFVGIDGVMFANSTEAKASYVSVSGEGLTESREALNDLKLETGSFGVTIQNKTTQESEKSLQSRIQLQTDKLRSLSLTGANLIQWILNTIDVWMGGGDNSITVTGNTDFRTEQEQSNELKEMSEVWNSGALTDEAFYTWQVKNKFETLDFEEWQKKIMIKNSANVSTKNQLDDEITKQEV